MILRNVLKQFNNSCTGNTIKIMTITLYLYISRFSTIMQSSVVTLASYTPHKESYFLNVYLFNFNYLQ
jgi:hypothetical protein